MFEKMIQRKKKYFILTVLLYGILCTLVSAPPLLANSEECVGFDVEFIAQKLNISVQKLMKAFGPPGKELPTFQTIANNLNITEKSLREAIGISEGVEFCRHEDPFEKMGTKKVMINSIEFNVSKAYKFFRWKDIPSDVIYKRQEVKTFTNPNGETHYFEVVYVSSGNLNWYQAAYLADDAGGYLASITSEEENAFVFGLVSDQKYFWVFPKGGPINHFEISIGPFLGGYQPEGSAEPDGGWSWLSGEPWSYSNWAINLDDGVIDKDPRPNDQPNNSGGNQPIMGFGEMNLPVSTWGDYMDSVGTYGFEKLPGRSYGFIIEYNQKP